MAIDTTPSEVATTALSALPFGNIIGGPLKACIEAQTLATQSTLNFINEVGLTEKDGEKQIVNVTFEYIKNGRYYKMIVPLLTIVPIPYLSIKDISINFKASISASSSKSNTTSDSFSFSAGMKVKGGFHAGIAYGSMEMSASVSSKKDSKATQESKYSVEYTMDVSVRAGQEDMPAGMSRVLEMLNESIDTVNAKGELQVTGDSIKLDENGSGGVFATYKNTSGVYEPEAIKVLDDKENEVDDNTCVLTVSDIGVVCMFKKVGAYIVSAGDSTQPIFVQ